MRDGQTRRRFLATSAACAVAGVRSAHPQPSGITADQEEAGAFSLSRFKFIGGRRAQDNWDVEPRGDENLLRRVREVTNIRLTERTWAERVVHIDDSERMKATPFLFMTGEVDFKFTPGEREIMAEFLRRGGFLLADDCIANVPMQRYFYDALRREVPLILPGHQLEPIRNDHEIYHCFYDIPNGAPWWPNHEINARPRFPDLGLEFDGRLAIFLTAADIHCSWTQRHAAARAVFEEAVQLGTNIIIYALSH